MELIKVIDFFFDVEVGVWFVLVLEVDLVVVEVDLPCGVVNEEVVEGVSPGLDVGEHIVGTEEDGLELVAAE